uniref:Sentrin-specific protease 6-like n=1 Tax=Phallusia mammillata TaxID=59560 RepID=A0A6F9DS23_9ASCI|nr:sentrin-specific protease 6-like [Phallusia mammillata]
MSQQPGNSQKILIRLPSAKHANINLLSVAESGNQFVTQSPKQVGVPVRIQTFTTSSRNNNVLVQGTPVIMVQPTTDSNQNMPQLVSEKRMLCSNCGATLKGPLKYKCCSKSSIRPIQVTSLQKPTTQPRACLGGYSSPAKVKPRQNRRMNASTFYGERNGASEFHSFLASKRRNETIKVKKSCHLVPQDNNCKSEFITISDSSDEAEVETDVGKESAKKQKLAELQPCEDKTTSETTCNNSPKQPESIFLQQVHTNGDDSPIPCKRRKESLNENEAVQSTTETTSHIQATCQKTLPAWKTATLCVLLKSVRIGQFHHKEPVQCRWSGKDISMTMQSCIVQIPWYAISKVELSVEDPQACIFFTIDNDYVPSLRSQLGMVPGKIPYFDPGGTDDQIFIIFYICSQWHSIQGDLIPQKLDFLRRKLQKPQSFVAKLTRTESNNRQCRIANAELVQHFGKTNISKELTPHQSPAQNHHSKSMMVSSPVGSSQVAKHTTQILHVGMSPEQKLIRFTRSRSNRLPQAVAVNDCIDVHPVFQGQRKQLAIYPPPPAKGGITITNEDQFCLNEGEFLNDVIIDFYLKYIMEEILSPTDRDRSHIFSCFFYKRLTQNPAGKAKANEDKNLNPSERRHRRVQKWTRNVDLFEKDFVFIPINEASHWFLAVICFPGQKVGYFVDSSTGTQVTDVGL